MATTYSIPSQILAYIKSLGYSVCYGEMEGYIKQWGTMYRADGDFWNRRETDGKRIYHVKRRTVKPAKRVCREWASLMLNEDTVINVENETCNEWLAEYFNLIKFWSRGQNLIEKTFAMGTGAWALWLDTESGKMQVRRYDANMILILSWDDDGVSEVAFCSKVNYAGKDYNQLQIHQLQEDGYHIITQLFDDKGNSVAIDGVLPDFSTGSSDPWFAVITPAIENTCVDFSPYGMSIFADAIDILETVDIAYDAFTTEPQTGKMRLFMADQLFQVGEDSGEKVVYPFGKDDASFFRGVFDIEGQMIKEFAPALRTEELIRTYRGTLQTLGDACGFGMNYFDTDDSGGIKTATEVSSDNSQLMRNIRKHENLIGDAIEQIVRAVLQGARKLGATLPDEGDITVTFDDSIITDTETEKKQDLSEVGVTLNAWEYRVKWYGEDEETAKANVPGQANEDYIDVIE